MTKVPVYSLKGETSSEVELPAAFAAVVRFDVIRKAVRVARANRRQRYGASPWAGMMHSTKGAGKGKGMSRVPRIQGSGTAALAPPTVGGRRAHPPEARKDWSRKINAKEQKVAVRSGLAATASRELVEKRGHRIKADARLPIVVEDAFEGMAKTSDLIAFLTKIGLEAELERAHDGVHVRAGRGKMRGRRFKRPVSLLVVANMTETLRRGAGNLVGVEVTTPQGLNPEHLAPGGDPGRLTLFTIGALKQMGAV